jgi:hypothetical protein
MGYDAVGKIYIPTGDFWTFVSKYLPPGMASCYMSFNPNIEVGEGDEVIIDYAASTECHPHDWVTPPDFAKEQPAIALKTIKLDGT